MRDYGIYSLKLLSGKTIYCISYIDKKDGVLLDNNNNILFFDELQLCLNYITEKNIIIEHDETDFTNKDPFLINLDIIHDMLTNKRIMQKNKNKLLTFLNITDDMFKSVGQTFKGLKKRYDLIYKKLTYSSTFLGNGKQYFLTSKEKRKITNLLRNALYFLYSQLNLSQIELY